MTQCNTKHIEFSRLSRRKIRADFDGGKITSDAGALLIPEVDRQLGLIEAINTCIPDPRNQDPIIHKQKTLLAQRTTIVFVYFDNLTLYGILNN